MKRFVSLLLCLCLLLSVTVLCCSAFQTDYTGISVTVGDVTLPLPEYPVGSKCLNTSDGTFYPLPDGGTVNVYGYQCYGFARYVFYRCFGVVDSTYAGGKGYHSVVSNVAASKITVDYLKGILGVTVLAGAHIRAGFSSSTGHSMVFMCCDDNYVYTYEGNYDRKCTVTVNKRTWEEFRDYCKRKGGIEFIHMPDVYPGNTEINGFTDMPDETDWAYPGLQFMLENGLFAGTSKTTVSPDMEMTRAMLVTVLWRLEGAPEITEESPFTDVQASDWFAQAVLWAEKAGIVSGIGEGKFGPNLTVTREQIAVILYNGVRYDLGELTSPGEEDAEDAGEDKDTTQTPGETAESDELPESLGAFPDGDEVSSWAREGLAWAVSNGFISGSVENGVTCLKPRAGGTRAQVASIVMRFCTAGAQETGE